MFIQNKFAKSLVTIGLLTSTTMLAGCMTSSSSDELAALEQGLVTPIDPNSPVTVENLDANGQPTEAAKLDAENKDLASQITPASLTTDAPADPNAVTADAEGEIPGIENTTQVDTLSIQSRVDQQISSITGIPLVEETPEPDPATLDASNTDPATLDALATGDPAALPAGDPLAPVTNAEPLSNPVDDGQAVAAANVDVEDPIVATACPTAQIRSGSLTKYKGGKGSSNRRFTASIVSTSQKCQTQYGNVTVQVAIAGVLDYGPKAEVGQTMLPLEVKAVADGRTIYSRVYTVKAWVSPEQPRGKFAKILGSVQIPAEKAKDAQVFIGFDS